MKKRACLLLISLGLLTTGVATAQGEEGKAVAEPVIPEPDKVVEYRATVDAEGAAVRLELELFLPQGHAQTDARAAAVFFFGGGWSGGTTRQMRPFARHLAQRGMVAACADYRVSSRHETDPFACVEDAKAAVRYMRGHAAELGVDPERIAVGGGSAGGHLAACTGILEGLEGTAIGVDDGVSSRPVAMILFNPVLDTSAGGYGNNKLKERWRELSVNHHLREDLPAAIVFHGTADTTVPFANATAFEQGMKAAGNTCELLAFEGRQHGFFNAPAFRPASDGVDYAACVEAMDAFLVERGLLDE